ncbi:MAG: hypothetical protein KatS3mg097_623 [Candidatus Parcubacteria bacterium]|nr:MAG: hypothetical protein KatS3mg097_623 [Candidatus Parcubacteria bacterium]
MDKYLRNSIIIGIFLFIIALFLGIYTFSDILKSLRLSQSFSVSAEGKEVVIPNIAQLTIGLITEGESLLKIQKINTEKFNKVIKFLKDQGIDEKDIKTENYSVKPIYDYKKSPYQIVAYSINQNVLVKIRDLNKVNVILSGVVQNGANNISGPNFVVDDPEIYLDKARDKAIKLAKEKAEKIAKTAGIRLGKIINISESSYSPMPIYMKAMEIGGGESGALPSIEPGSQEIKIWVTITYEIK